MDYIRINPADNVAVALQDLRKGTVVEGGCSIDLPIEPVSNSLVNSIVGAIGIDDGLPTYLNYFDDKNLDEMMNSWFGEAAQMDQAA